MKTWFLALALVPMGYANAADYTLEGRIIGFADKDHPLSKHRGFCYVAIQDSKASFSRIYQRIDDAGICTTAQVAYLLREPVKAAGQIDRFPIVPRLKSIELKRNDRPHVLPVADAQAAARKYAMRGYVSGYMAQKKSSCQIAIATSDLRYRDAYHLVSDQRMCKFALAAYVSRSAISAKAISSGSAASEITDLEARRSEATYWPPYHDHGATRGEYGLYGPVGGYALTRGGGSCFVAIDGDLPRSNGYHQVQDRSSCAALLSAYLSGSPVAVVAERAAGDEVNHLTKVDVGAEQKAYWPPYGQRR